jgi:hypothetical protein
MNDDPKISQRYRELEREEPPRHLDDAILAASRRAVEARPAPLVVPSGRRRWYFPVAAAAIIVLAVAVTVHVEREQPDPEAVAMRSVPPASVPAPQARVEEKPMQSPPPAAAPATPPAAAAKRDRFTPDPKPSTPTPKEAAPAARESREAGARRDAEVLARRDAESRAQRDAELRARDEAIAAMNRVQAQRAPASEAPAAASAPSLAQDRLREQQGSRRADAANEPARAENRYAMPERAIVGSAARIIPPSPEQLLQGIADLRRQGRHDEANRALDELRRAYPDYAADGAPLKERLAKRETAPEAARAEERARAATQAEVQALGAVAAAMGRAERGLAAASPEQWLQGIADLRRQGRHDEADKALAEFRRTYPDYKISETMRAKVEKK